MENKVRSYKINVRLWKGIATVAAAFSFIVCFLVIVNYLQIKRIDPINTEVINSLVERLNENPEDNELREEIRELDLLVRKAYFTNWWQIRMGGYLLLIGVAILIIALHIISSDKTKEPVESSEKEENILFTQRKARKWISISGVSLVLVTFVLAFITHNELGRSFAESAIAANIHNDSINNLINELTEKETVSPISTDKTTEIETNLEKKEAIIQEETNSQQFVNKSQSTEKSEYPSYEDIIKNFPTFRGPGGNGIAYQKNIPVSWDGKTGKNIIWKIALPLPGYNSPIIWDNRLFLTGANTTKREVYCIDRHTGKLLWTENVNNIPGSPAQSPAVGNETGQAAPTAATDGRRVYAIFANGDIIAVNMEGTRIWAKNLGIPKNHYGHSSSLMMFRDMVIVQYDHQISANLLCLSAQSGKTKWSTNRQVNISWASPVVVPTGERTEIFLAADPYVASYDPLTGKELWKINCIFGEVGPSVAYADGIVFALNEYAKLVALKLGEKPEILWEDNEYLSEVPSPVATSKYLFVVTNYGMVVCYDTKTGTKLWEQEFDNGIYSSPVIVEEKVYLLDRQGIMHIFKVDKEYVSIGEPQLCENSVCTPAFADGRIYIRGDKNLYCIGN